MVRSWRIGSARAATWLAAVGLAVSVTACSSDDDPESDTPRVVQLGGPGETGRELSEDELDELDETSYTAADVAFAQNMIPHHEQALEMIALIDQRSQSPDVPKIAERMQVSQRTEIGLLEDWLTGRDEEVPSGQHHHGAHHEQLMPGMLTGAEMEQLADSRGRAFDRLFVQYMIRHHEGAMIMVEDLLASGNGQEPNLFQIAQQISSDQAIEIARMKQLLTQL
jgi:uncharacterized protein (DUF305 family)